jgi:hypothetical protein
MRTGKVSIGVLIVVFLMTCLSFSTAHAQGSYPNLGIWLNQWFKVSLSLQRLYFSDIGVAPDPGLDVVKSTGYLICTDLTQTPFDPIVSPILSCDIYVQNDAAVWEPYPFDFHYVGGDVSNFASWAETLGNAFTVQVKGTQKTNGTFSGATIKTLGGFSWEIDNVPGSTERWVGSLKFSGSWVNPTTLCKSPKNSALPPCIP